MSKSDVLTDALAFAAAQAAFLAAVAASKLSGRGDEKAADQAAVDALRTALNAMPIKGRIVIGEGERDEAPMLYIGEEVGLGTGPQIDIALDPLEGTTLTAKAMANALAVMAFAPKGGLLYAPDTYMDKLAIGPGFKADVVDLDAPAGDNAVALAKAKGVAVSELGVCVLDRPRHKDILASLRAVGARVHLISDGDVAGVINTTDPATGIDMYVGQGGAPEGVLAAAALKCVGGQFQGRLVFRNDDERARAAKTGITTFDRRYTLQELASTDAIFVAAGVTNGSMLKGVRIIDGRAHGEALVMNSATGLIAQVAFNQKVG
jgi:fructose-1,6-bisphosphatase II / sedoheptulose-1,7-bisphosphatase